MSAPLRPQDVPCPHCHAMFAEPNDVYNHIRSKHGGRGSGAYRARKKPPQKPRQAREQSVADELVDALLAAGCGEDVPEHIALMFPDEIAEARRR